MGFLRQLPICSANDILYALAREFVVAQMHLLNGLAHFKHLSKRLGSFVIDGVAEKLQNTKVGTAS